MKLKAKQAFSWAHDHVRVEEFAKGQTIETDDQDLIRVSLEEGWTVKDTSKSKEDKEEKADPKALLEKEIADLEAQIKAASEADAPALQTELDAKRAALAAL